MALTGMIDLHCDTLLKFRRAGLAAPDLLDKTNHVAINKLPNDLRWSQLFAIFCPDKIRGEEAKVFFDTMCDHFYDQMEAHKDIIAPAKNFAEFCEIIAGGRFAAILSVEGAAVVAGELDRVEYIAKKGVKAMTLTWNGENEIASGSVTQNGVSAFGREAIPEMERCGIIVDISHINDVGFEDVCALTKKPFIASHSNSRAVCNHLRNVTDEQFKEYVRRGGLVGLNFFKDFVRDDAGEYTFDDIYRHVEHFLSLGGEDVIALGSDYDGASISPCLDSVEKEMGIYDYLIGKGVSHTIADKIMYQNAFNFFKKYL